MRPCSFTMVFIDAWISCFHFPGSNLENKQQNYRFYDRNPYVDSKQHKFISQIMESVYVFGIKLKTEVASETEIA